VWNGGNDNKFKELLARDHPLLAASMKQILGSHLCERKRK